MTLADEDIYSIYLMPLLSIILLLIDVDVVVALTLRNSTYGAVNEYRIPPLSTIYAKSKTQPCPVSFRCPDERKTFPGHPPDGASRSNFFGHHFSCLIIEDIVNCF